MSWGDWGKKFSIPQMQELIEKAVDIEFIHLTTLISMGDIRQKSFGEAFKRVLCLEKKSVYY